MSSSSGIACHCSTKTDARGKTRRRVPGPDWRVVHRECHYSAFGGGRYQPSKYSLLLCVECGAQWRTRMSYVEQVPDVEEGEWP